MNCQNCTTALVGDYCHTCGQKSLTNRLTVKSVVLDFFHALTHADKGFLRLVKTLVRQPGIAAREYVEGKRKRYFNPLTFLVICAAIHFYFTTQTGYFDAVQPPAPEGSIRQEMNEFMNNNLKAIDIFMLTPLIALYSWLFFRKPRYNLAEHLVLQSFVLGQGLLIRVLIFVPLFVFFPKWAPLNVTVFQLTLLTYLIVAYRQFFRQHVAVTILKGVAIMIMYISTFWGIFYGLFALKRYIATGGI